MFHNGILITKVKPESTIILLCIRVNRVLRFFLDTCFFVVVAVVFLPVGEKTEHLLMSMLHHDVGLFDVIFAGT